MQKISPVSNNYVLKYLKQSLVTDQFIQFQQAIQQFQPNPNITIAALKLYVHLRNYQQLIFQHSTTLMINCAFIIAEINNLSTAINGEQTKIIAILMNQLIRRCHYHQEKYGMKLSFILKFYASVAVKNDYLSLQINNFAIEIQLWMRCAQNMSSLLDKLIFNLEQNTYHKQIFLSFSWLLFINAYYVLKPSCISISYLMAAVFYSVVRYSLPNMDINSFFTCNISHECNSYQPTKRIKIDDKRSIITVIIQKVIQIFEINNIPLFKQISDKFDLYLQQLLQKDIIKCKNILDFLSPNLIYSNYRRLDYQFQKNLQISKMDYRLFLRKRILTLSPNKFIEQQNHYLQMGKKKIYRNNLKYTTKQKNTFLKRETFCHSGILDFNQQFIFPSPSQDNYSDIYSPSAIQCYIPQNVQISSIKFKHKLPLMKIPTKLCLNEHQPYLVTYQYLQSIKQSTPVASLKTLFLINQTLSYFQIKTDIADNIYQVYFSLAKYFFQDTDYQETECLHLSLLTFSLYLILLSNTDAPPSLHQVSYQLKPYTLDLWIVSSFILEFDQNIPNETLIHIEFINQQLLQFYIWSDANFKQQLIHFSSHINQSFQTIKNRNQIQGTAPLQDDEEFDSIISEERKIQFFVKEAIYYVQIQVKNISNIIFTDKIIKSIQRNINYQQIILQQVLLCMQYWMIIGQIEGKNLSQILICTYYLICKINHYEIKFNEIKNAHEITNSKLHKAYNILQIQIYDHTIDIIYFYNHYFIPKAKPCLHFMFNSYHINKSDHELNYTFIQPMDKQQKQNNTNFEVKQLQQKFENYQSNKNKSTLNEKDIQKDISKDISRCQTRLKSRPLVKQELFII